MSQIPPLSERSLVNEFIVSQFNETLDKLSKVAGTDFSSYKIPDSQRNTDWPGKYEADSVRVQLGRVISKLEEEHRFSEANNNQSPGIVIFNKNEIIKHTCGADGVRTRDLFRDSETSNMFMC